MKAVLVTTVHRGVFFGELEDGQDENAKTLVLINCRNAIYWSGKKGFLGLAADGPEKNSRIGSEAPRVLLHDVTSVSDVTDAGAEAWREYPCG